MLFLECRQLAFSINVLPNALHISPIRDYSVFHWIFNCHHSSKIGIRGRWSFLIEPVIFCKRTDKIVSFDSTLHDSGVLRTSDIVSEVAFWHLISGKSRLVFVIKKGLNWLTDLYHSRAIIYDDRLICYNTVRIHSFIKHFKDQIIAEASRERFINTFGQL